MPKHTPYFCLEHMIVEAKPNATTEIPFIFRNLDSCDLHACTFSFSAGWHPPNGRPWNSAGLPVERTFLRDAAEAPFYSVKLHPGGERRGKFCITIGDVTEPGYITPVVTVRRAGGMTGAQSVNFFEWEGSVVYAGGMSEAEASYFLYPTGPLR